jgi:hypothetical protein
LRFTVLAIIGSWKFVLEFVENKEPNEPMLNLVELCKLEFFGYGVFLGFVVWRRNMFVVVVDWAALLWTRPILFSFFLLTNSFILLGCVRPFLLQDFFSPCFVFFPLLFYFYKGCWKQCLFFMFWIYFKNNLSSLFIL